MKTRAPFLAILCVLGIVFEGTHADGRASSSDSSASPEDRVGPKFRPRGRGIPNEYIVVLEDPGSADPRRERALAVREQEIEVFNVADELTVRYGGSTGHVWATALRGFSASMTEDAARALSEDPRVAFVEQSVGFLPATSEPNAPWNLDRLDHRSGRDGSYDYSVTGLGVHVYLFDTGVYCQHPEFGGRADIVYDWFASPADTYAACMSNGTVTTRGHDCYGHGTHVAAIVGGVHYGVAKDALLHEIRVFSCCGGCAQSQSQTLLDAINWLAGHHQSPAVANMSLAGGASDALDTAVRGLIGAGVTTVVAAGNGVNNRDGPATDAGTLSPARVSEAITVSATDINDTRTCGAFPPQFNSTDTICPNYGSVVDVFAPGIDVDSAWSPESIYIPGATTSHLSGTSMATPHVTGVVAQYLQLFPNATPAQVQAAIVNNATAGVVANPPPLPPSPFLYSSFVVKLSSLTISPGTITAGQSATGTVTLSGPAPFGGAAVSLSSNSIRASVPASVTIPQGSSSASFVISTSRSRGLATVTITGAYGTSITTGSFQLQGSVPIVVAFRQPIPATVGGTQTATGTVDIDLGAPAGGTVVSLSSSNPAAAKLPASVTVQENQTSASFTINTFVVPTITTVTLTATSSGTASTTLTVLPPAYEGYLDLADCNTVAGWGWDSYRPNTPINVDLYDGSSYLTTIAANAFRQDLLNAGKGNGYHGFFWTVPQSLKNGASHSIWAKFGGTQTALVSSPRTITCVPPSVGIYWVYPAEVTWGPPGTLTVAGWAQDGTGGVQMFWRDVTANPYGAFNAVAYMPAPDANGVWYNTIPSSNKCHTYEVKAVYAGVTSAVFTWVGATSGYCVSTIQVSSATYGTNCGAPIGNATWSVAPACNGKSSCSYAVYYTTLGDPAPGCAKDFRASWTCSGGTSPAPAYAPPEAGYGSVVTLRCP